MRSQRGWEAMGGCFDREGAQDFAFESALADQKSFKLLVLKAVEDVPMKVCRDVTARGLALLCRE